MAGDLLLLNEELLVNRIQELAITVDKPPSRFIIKDRDDEPIVQSSPILPPIPIIDLNLLFSSMLSPLNNEEGNEEMEKFRSALLSWGCFQAIGHGISSSILDELTKVSKGFFELPREEKQKYSKTVEGDEGYGSDQIISDEQVLDWADRLYLHVYPKDEKELKYWPEKPSGFREILEEYMDKIMLISELLFKAIAKSLKLDENCFLKECGERAALHARLNYYPHCSRPDLVFGVKPHSDGSDLTLLLQDDVEGLQVLKDGHWVTIPPLPNALVILIGDQLEIMSNGVLKGTVHRVLTNTERARLSLAAFRYPEYDKEIEPIDELIDDKRPKMYKKAKNYNDLQFPNFLLGKKTIEGFKL